MEQCLGEKIAIVTGAGQGIGKAVALRLAREGANVVVADINPKTAEQTAEEIQLLNRRALACHIDIANVAEIQPMIDHAVAEFSRIDILVNAAGVAQTGLFLELTEQEWDRVVDTNLKGTTFIIQAVGRQMIKQVPEQVKATESADSSYGKIVNFSSISGRHGRAEQIPYAASKAAIISITQSAALAFAKYNINVNAVCPGVVPTPMWEQIELDRGRISGLAPGESMKSFIERIPLKRPGSSEDVAGVVAFLCSPDSDYMTGQTLNIDGGFEMN
ncbi:MAG: SDR family NAD(P)-dependent oxidoreductase [Planctomycetota bacterium]|jgi:NAD(P)-dependent dehydrogenase (short-subunit alcohol dehydrogenase family)